MANLMRRPSSFPSFYNMFDEMLDSMQTFERPMATVFRMDVIDNDDNYIVEAEMPGISSDEIDLELNEGRLNISVEKKEEEKEEKKNYIHHERCGFKASRGVYLKDAATEGVKANLNNGVLTVTVPKKDETINSTKIEIEE